MKTLCIKSKSWDRCQAWYCMPVTPAFRELRQENPKLKASLRPHLKQQKQTQKPYTKYGTSYKTNNSIFN